MRQSRHLLFDESPRSRRCAAESPGKSIASRRRTPAPSTVCTSILKNLKNSHISAFKATLKSQNSIKTSLQTDHSARYKSSSDARRADLRFDKLAGRHRLVAGVGDEAPGRFGREPSEMIVPREDLHVAQTYFAAAEFDAQSHQNIFQRRRIFVAFSPANCSVESGVGSPVSVSARCFPSRSFAFQLPPASRSRFADRTFLDF